MQQLLNLFPLSFDYIYATATPGGTDLDWTTHNRYRLTQAELVRKWADPELVIGLRPLKETLKLTIDIDRGSKYHAFNNYPLYQELRDHLAQIGLQDGEIIRSSASDGHHLIYVFSEEINSFDLACVVRIHLEGGGFDLGNGQIETFPNVKAYDSNYKAVRLPFQEGSELLDADFNPVPQSHEDSMAYLVSRIENNDNDLDLLKSTIRKYKRNGSFKKLFERGHRLGSSKIQEMYRDWTETIAMSWTAPGQTNDLLNTYCQYTIVFEGIIDPRELCERVKSQVIVAPGYDRYCSHQHEIDRRIEERVRCALKRYYPYGQRELLGKGGEYQPPKRPRSTVRTDGVIQRIHDAIELIKQRYGGLPQKMTARLNAIMKASKELGRGLSRDTLYGKCYKALWQQAETAEIRQESQTETEIEVYPISVTENIEAKDSEIQAQTEVYYISAPMKRCPTLGVDVTGLEVDLGELGGLEVGEDLDPIELTLVDRAVSAPQNCEGSNDELLNHPQSSLPEEGSGSIRAIDRVNSQSTISDSYGLEPAAPPEDSISDADESTIALPLPGMVVKRRSHVYRNKSYPQVLGKVIRSVGMGWEAVTDAGGRYRFDLSDWLDTWFPLLE